MFPERVKRDPMIVPRLVSTIIPVFNRPILLREAVDSVLAQTYRPIEIIVVDDGSDQETAGVCDRLANSSDAITVIHQPHRGLAGQAREAGRLLARGEYIQYLDSDDLLCPRKFEVMVRALQQQPECDIAYCYTRRYFRGDTPEDVPCERTGYTFDRMLPDFLAGRYWHTCTPLYTRRICDRAGAWSDLRYWEDVEYDLRIAVMGIRLCHSREFLADFRDHVDERLSHADFFSDPTSMRHAPRAYQALCHHARRSGVAREHPAMQSFVSELRSIAEHCSRLGLASEAAACEALLASL